LIPSAHERTSRVAVHAQGKLRRTIQRKIVCPIHGHAIIYGNVMPQFVRQKILVALNRLGKLL
jgi:hypothetical protein